IIFEMTGSYGLILPLMIANMTSYAIARRYRKLPIYDALLEQDGIYLPHSKGRGKHAIEKLSVGQAMTPSVVTLPSTITADAALEKVRNYSFAVYPVVDPVDRCL